MTHVLTIDGRQFSDGKAVHRMLKKLLCLPDYYGGNADALRVVEHRRTGRCRIAAANDDLRPFGARRPSVLSPWAA